MKIIRLAVLLCGITAVASSCALTHSVSVKRASTTRPDYQHVAWHLVPKITYHEVLDSEQAKLANLTWLPVAVAPPADAQKDARQVWQAVRTRLKGERLRLAARSPYTLRLDVAWDMRGTAHLALSAYYRHELLFVVRDTSSVGAAPPIQRLLGNALRGIRQPICFC